MNETNTVNRGKEGKVGFRCGKEDRKRFRYCDNLLIIFGFLNLPTLDTTGVQNHNRTKGVKTPTEPNFD